MKIRSGPVFCLFLARPGPRPVLQNQKSKKDRTEPVRTGPCRSFAVLSGPRPVLGPVLGIYFLYTTNKIQLYLLKFKKDAHALEMQDGGAGRVERTSVSRFKRGKGGRWQKTPPVKTRRAREGVGSITNATRRVKRLLVVLKLCKSLVYNQ